MAPTAYILSFLLALAPASCATTVAIANDAHKTKTKTSSTTTTTTSPSPTCQHHVATYDNLSGAHPASGFNYQGLHYEGFTIERAALNSTHFSASSGDFVLALAWPTIGNISVIPSKGSYFYPGNFTIGCSRLKDGEVQRSGCDVTLATPVQGYGGEEDISIPLSDGEYHKRELVMGNWGGPATPYITFDVYSGTEGVVLYWDSMDFTLGCVG